MRDSPKTSDCDRPGLMGSIRIYGGDWLDCVVDYDQLATRHIKSGLDAASNACGDDGNRCFNADVPAFILQM